VQKADALQLMKSDLEDTVSAMRKEQYERAAQRATTPDELKTLDFQVKADTRLRPDHKNQVLQRIERSIRRAESLAAVTGGAERVKVPASLSAPSSPQAPRR